MDGWASSSLHEQTECAATAEEQEHLYAAWADSYDAEMIQNNLQSYKSVTELLLTYWADRGRPGSLHVLDVGCGTGLLGEHLLNELERSLSVCRSHVNLTGFDLSSHMLAKAASRGCYHRVFQGNLNVGLHDSVRNRRYHLIVSSGLFMPGHCGPLALSNMLCALEKDGLAVFTVRKSLFDSKLDDFESAIRSTSCSTIGTFLKPYYGSIRAYVVVVQKC